MITQLFWDHRSFGLPEIDSQQLVVHGPEQSAERIREILRGQPGPSRDIVVANAAAGLWVSNKTHSLLDGAQRAQHAIDSGEALKILERLASLTHAQA
jgi:anthranilate phosphoribosyltransferase